MWSVVLTNGILFCHDVPPSSSFHIQNSHTFTTQYQAIKQPNSTCSRVLGQSQIDLSAASLLSFVVALAHMAPVRLSAGKDDPILRISSSMPFSPSTGEAGHCAQDVKVCSFDHGLSAQKLTRQCSLHNHTSSIDLSLLALIAILQFPLVHQPSTFADEISSSLHRPLSSETPERLPQAFPNPPPLAHGREALTRDLAWLPACTAHDMCFDVDSGTVPVVQHPTGNQILEALGRETLSSVWQFALRVNHILGINGQVPEGNQAVESMRAGTLAVAPGLKKRELSSSRKAEVSERRRTRNRD